MLETQGGFEVGTGAVMRAEPVKIALITVDSETLGCADQPHRPYQTLDKTFVRLQPSFGPHDNLARDATCVYDDRGSKNSASCTESSSLINSG